MSWLISFVYFLYSRTEKNAKQGRIQKWKILGQWLDSNSQPSTYNLEAITVVLWIWFDAIRLKVNNIHISFDVYKEVRSTRSIPSSEYFVVYCIELTNTKHLQWPIAKVYGYCINKTLFYTQIHEKNTPDSDLIIVFNLFPWRNGRKRKVVSCLLRVPLRSTKPIS